MPTLEEQLFHHLHRVFETTHIRHGRTYEIKVFRSKEDGHYPVYVSTDALSDVVILEVEDKTLTSRPINEQAAINLAIDRAKRALDAGDLSLE